MPAEMTKLVDETLARMERYERFRAMADEPAERYENSDVLGEGATESITPRDDDPVGAIRGIPMGLGIMAALFIVGGAWWYLNGGVR